MITSTAKPTSRKIRSKSLEKKKYLKLTMLAREKERSQQKNSDTASTTAKKGSPAKGAIGQKKEKKNKRGAETQDKSGKP